MVTDILMTGRECHPGNRLMAVVFGTKCRHQPESVIQHLVRDLAVALIGRINHLDEGKTVFGMRSLTVSEHRAMYCGIFLLPLVKTVH